MKPEKQIKPMSQASRRAFLRQSVMIGASVATVVAVPTQVLASVEKTTKVMPKKEEGYRMTKHIAEYYKSTQL